MFIYVVVVDVTRPRATQVRARVTRPRTSREHAADGQAADSQKNGGGQSSEEEKTPVSSLEMVVTKLFPKVPNVMRTLQTSITAAERRVKRIYNR